METIPIPGAEIYFERNFLSPEEATTLFNLLWTKCAWERRRTSFNSAVPRDEAYYGDPGTSYTYSRREYKPLAWIPELLSLTAVTFAPGTAAPLWSVTCPAMALVVSPCGLASPGHNSERTSSAVGKALLDLGIAKTDYTGVDDLARAMRLRTLP
jgi:hypothetical protein